LKALKISALILGLLILGGLSVLLITAMKVPDQFMQEFREETSKIKNNQVVLSYPDDLLKKKTSLDARLAMSDDDSIGLRISLKDKAMYLEIQGIVLHKTPIIEEHTSSFFKNLTTAEKYVLFHKPMKINSDESNIAKDVFTEVIAPKDSVEAEQRKEIIPDTIQREPILYRLYLDHGIRVQITGQLPDTIPQFWPRFRFDLQDRKKFLKGLKESVLNKKPVPYHPTISILINSRDAESIYRAVPKNGNIILEF